MREKSAWHACGLGVYFQRLEFTETRKEESALDVSFVRLGAPWWLVFLENACKAVQVTLSMACPSKTTLYIGPGTDPGDRDETGEKRVPGTPAGIGVYFLRLEFTETFGEERKKNRRLMYPLCALVRLCG
jgi:hypothetical protein